MPEQFGLEKKNRHPILQGETVWSKFRNRLGIGKLEGNPQKPGPSTCSDRKRGRICVFQDSIICPTWASLAKKTLKKHAKQETRELASGLPQQEIGKHELRRLSFWDSGTENQFL